MIKDRLYLALFTLTLLVLPFTTWMGWVEGTLELGIYTLYLIGTLFFNAFIFCRLFLDTKDHEVNRLKRYAFWLVASSLVFFGLGQMVFLPLSIGAFMAFVRLYDVLV